MPKRTAGWSRESGGEMSERITIVGTVATDPERRQTNGGIPVMTFRLASNRTKLDRATGEWVDDGTSWYSVSAYRGLAENGLASFKRGQRVIVAGRFRLRSWESGDKRGVEAEVDADALGHDLRWGSSSFERTASSASGSSAPEATPRDDVAEARSADEHEWAPVGATPF